MFRHHLVILVAEFLSSFLLPRLLTFLLVRPVLRLLRLRHLRQIWLVVRVCWQQTAAEVCHVPIRAAARLLLPFLPLLVLLHLDTATLAIRARLVTEKTTRELCQRSTHVRENYINVHSPHYTGIQQIIIIHQVVTSTQYIVCAADNWGNYSYSRYLLTTHTHTYRPRGQHLVALTSRC